MSKLKSLEEHNSTAREIHWAMNDNSPRPNGIVCPKCGEELLDSNPMMKLTSNPPMKDVKCSKCDYAGYRVC